MDAIAKSGFHPEMELLLRRAIQNNFEDRLYSFYLPYKNLNKVTWRSKRPNHLQKLGIKKECWKEICSE